MLKRERLVSVVIPVFNAENFLADCIHSVLNQSHSNVEILVIDDGSTDNSRSIAEEFALDHQQIEILEHPERKNLGVSFTRQLGIERASGEFIAFLDADDCYEPTKIEQQIRQLDQHPGSVLSHTGVSIISDSESDADVFENHFNRIADKPYEYFLRERVDFLTENIICNSSVMVRSGPIRSFKIAFPQMFQYEDWTLWIRLSSFGHFLFLPDRLTKYRLHPNTATEKVMTNELVRNYSHLEFLLAVASNSDSLDLSQKLGTEIHDRISRLLALYCGSHEGLSREIKSEKLAELAIARHNFDRILSENAALRDLELSLRKSISYRIGRLITWPIRGIRDRLRS